MITTRKEIFKWANQYGVFISDDLNSIIQKAYYDKHGLMQEVDIFVNQRDIEEIKSRFDKYNSRLVAFAFLCYAKRFADKDGMFRLSIVGVANWIGIDNSNVSKYVNEMVDFGYVKKFNERELTYIKKRKSGIDKINAFKICYGLVNEGEYKIKDIDFVAEFEEIFN